jgi:ATP dependent DNA ligase domain
MTLRPMLAESITLADLPKYIRDDQWIGQLKADGHRLLVCVEDGQVAALGRNGQAKMSGLSHKLLSQFEVFDKGKWVFDGELIGSQLVLFDLVYAAGYCTPTTPFKERYQVLKTLYQDVWKPDVDAIVLLPIHTGADGKLALVQSAEQEQREGVMLRHVTGQYRSGGRSSHLLKAKFTKEADCIIYDTNTNGHENVELVLLDPEGKFPPASGYPTGILPVGSASAIGKKPKPEKLDVWEVRYLYVVDQDRPRLYQPRLMRKRTDKDLPECVVDQIANAFTDKNLVDKVRAEM